MGTTPQQVRDGNSGDLSRGFGGEADPDLEGVAVLGGEDPTVIAQYIREMRERREEAGDPQVEERHCAR